MIHKCLKSCLATAVLGAALCAPAAHAAIDFVLTPSNPSDSEFVSILLGSTDEIAFTLNMFGAPNTVGDATSTLDLSTLLSAGNLSVEIFNATSTGFATTTTGNQMSLPVIGVLTTYASFANLLDGHYVARFTKTGLLSVNVAHTFTAHSTTPVPEAETYAMMLAGLGLVGTMVARRRHA